LAMRKQNSTNSSKPPSSDGDWPAIRANVGGGGRRAHASRADSRVMPDGHGNWYLRNVWVNSWTCIRTNVEDAVNNCPRRAKASSNPATHVDIKSLRFRRSSRKSPSIACIR
jgi:hypothetical protein